MADLVVFLGKRHFADVVQGVLVEFTQDVFDLLVVFAFEKSVQLAFNDTVELDELADDVF